MRGTCDVWRMRRTRSITPASVVPDFRERSDARWMVGPSASGSLNGTPSSITSAPASARARTNLCVASSDGSPAVMYATMPSSPAARSSAKRFEIRVEFWDALVIAVGRLKQPLIRVHVLVAAAGEVEDDQVAGLELRQAFDEARDGVRGFERGDNTFGERKKLCRIERRLIVNRGIFGAMLIREPRMLRADGRIIKAGGNGMRGGDLAVFILQDVRVGALQNARTRARESLVSGEARGVFAEAIAAATAFDANHFHVGVLQEFMK